MSVIGSNLQAKETDGSDPVYMYEYMRGYSVRKITSNFGRSLNVNVAKLLSADMILANNFILRKLIKTTEPVYYTIRKYSSFTFMIKNEHKDILWRNHFRYIPPIRLLKYILFCIKYIKSNFTKV